MPIDFENITDHTGVRIYNFDASKNVDEDDLNEIKELMQNKHFICFKNQKFDEDSLINFCKNFVTIDYLMGLFLNYNKKKPHACGVF